MRVFPLLSLATGMLSEERANALLCRQSSAKGRYVSYLGASKESAKREPERWASQRERVWYPHIWMMQFARKGDVICRVLIVAGVK